MTEKAREPLSPQDWLGVGIRIFAVWLLVESLQYVVIFAELRMRQASLPTFRGALDSDLNPMGYLVYVIGYGLLSAFLLRCAPLLVAFAYPSSDDEELVEPPPANSGLADEGDSGG